MKFSVVCPVKDELHLIPITLPSFYEVAPSEVVLCFDDPPHEPSLQLAKYIATSYDVATKFVFVNRNKDYAFHQAWVRRRGFLEASHNKILTCDIDLVINSSVLKAVEKVGRDNIGLVSCSKMYPQKGLGRIWKNVAYELVRHVYPIRFTGLYALYRPFWLDSEDEGIKKLTNPKQGSYGQVRMGEDSYLRDCMKRKHRCAYLKDVGATVLTFNIGDLPRIQFEHGRYFASQGYNIFRILAKAFLYWRVHIFRGWLYERRRMKHEFNS